MRHRTGLCDRDARPWETEWSSGLGFAEALIRASFYAYYLHEQVHHNVESLGLRFLVSTGSDRYLSYGSKVYSPTFLTSNCLEESLANADSVRRLGEPRYRERMPAQVRAALNSYLRATIRKQPKGYNEGLAFVSHASYEQGIWELQSRVLTSTYPAKFSKFHWAAAQHMIRSAMDIDRLSTQLCRADRNRFCGGAT